MQPLPTSSHSVTSCPFWFTVNDFSMSVAVRSEQMLHDPVERRLTISEFCIVVRHISKHWSN